MAQQIDLVYPLYLDVPMMTSFVAALEDGIAYGSDVVQTKDQRRTVTGEGEGKVNAGLPSMGILASLLNFDLRGKITGDQAAGSAEEITLVRRHTEASLFMRLRHRLKNDGRITEIDSIDKVQELKTTEQDRLIEIKGQVFRSPLSEILEAMFRVLDMLGMDLDSPAGRPQSGQGPKGKKRGGQQPPAPVAGESALDENARFGLKLMRRIKDDLAQSKVIDVVMRPAAVEELTLVIALASEFLPEGAMDNLLSGDFTVLGRVTQIVEGDDEISLYRRTMFSNLDSSDFDGMFTKMSEDAGLKTSGNPMTIEAPALQLMPLAIYA